MRLAQPRIPLCFRHAPRYFSQARRRTSCPFLCVAVVVRYLAFQTASLSRAAHGGSHIHVYPAYPFLAVQIVVFRITPRSASQHSVRLVGIQQFARIEYARIHHPKRRGYIAHIQSVAFVVPNTISVYFRHSSAIVIIIPCTFFFVKYVLEFLFLII